MNKTYLTKFAIGSIIDLEDKISHLNGNKW